MGVLRGQGGWCFCAGGKSERVKGSIFSTKAPALAAISSAAAAAVGTGFLIHRNLLLTTHTNIPSAAAADAAEICLHHGRLPARLVPHRFFITSSVLDLTIVGLDTVEDSSSQPHYLKTCCNPNLDLNSVVYLLGHTDKKEVMVGEGKVVIATDNLIKLSTDGVTWCPGSAGFDLQGNLAFMVCDPMKLASSPTAKSSSASSSSSLSWKRDSSTQFGIPIPIICDWLHQHWEGSLDEPSKPKLPIIRLMSASQRSEHSCASFTLRQIFKATEETAEISSSPLIVSRSRPPVTSSHEENQPAAVLHKQGIPTPQIYESPKLTSGPVRKKEHPPIQLLDINFPPRVPRPIALPLALKKLLPEPDGEVNEVAEIPQEEWSSSSPVEASKLQNDGFSSGEETMYSAETMESRNFPSPKRFQNVGRSQSCVSYGRWSSASFRGSGAARNGALQKQRSLVSARKARSQAAVLPQRSREYYSPTVSSTMKKKWNSEQTSRPHRKLIQVSPKWMF